MATWSSPLRRVSLHLWAHRHRVKILAILSAVAVAGLGIIVYSTSLVVSRFEGRRWNLPSRIYSDMFVLREGDGGSPEKLVSRLDRLLYERDEARPAHAGHYRRDGGVVEVFTRDFRYPGRFFRGYPVRVDFAGGRVRSIRDASGAPVPALAVEPERLGSIFGDEFEDRTLVRLSEVPRSLTDAILVTEDRDFYRHAGVSIRRSVGAMISNMKGGARQGGSTLTQQLVKNLYLTPKHAPPERTLRRKAIEAVLAVILDARYSKDEIFETYLNEIYLGRHGAIAVTGVGEAARHYFGKEAGDLDLAESATIAAIIKAPNV